MGFAADRVEAALKACAGREEAALEILLSSDESGPAPSPTVTNSNKNHPPGGGGGGSIVAKSASEGTPTATTTSTPLPSALTSVAPGWGDLKSPVSALLMCLDSSPDLSTTDAVLGPPGGGPCLLLASRGVCTPSQMRAMVEMHAFEVEDIDIPGISLDAKLAIRLYTAEVPVKIYELVNEPFKSQSRKPEHISNQAAFCKVLIRSIRALLQVPSMLYEGPAYRGVRIAGNADLQHRYDHHTEAYKIGDKLTFAPFTSLTLSQQVAEGFGDAIFFFFTHVRAVRIASLSAISSEEEVIMEPPCVFRIVSNGKFLGCLQVVLELVPSPLRYLSL